MTNKAEAVAALVGSHTATYQGNQFSGNNKALATLLKRDPAAITRMVASGVVPFRYTRQLMDWASERGLTDEISPLLEHTCPCCNSTIA